MFEKVCPYCQLLFTTPSSYGLHECVPASAPAAPSESRPEDVQLCENCEDWKRNYMAANRRANSAFSEGRTQGLIMALEIAKSRVSPIEITEAIRSPAPSPAPSTDRVGIYEALRLGRELVESAFAHVSHGGPTRADAEAWLKIAADALAEPDAPPLVTCDMNSTPHRRDVGGKCVEPKIPAPISTDMIGECLQELFQYARKQYRDCEIALRKAESDGVDSRGSSKASRQMRFTMGSQTAYEDIIRHAAPALAAEGKQNGT
jgi:hypothetical protein